MRDEMAARPEGSAKPSLTLTPTDDYLAHLEPLAVPFGRLTSILRRYWGTMLVVFVLGVASATTIVKSMTKRYTAEASILVEPQRTQVSDLQAISVDSGDIGTVVRTQIDILKSPTLAANVVKELDLIESPEFSAERGFLWREIETLLQKFNLSRPDPSRQPTLEDTIDIAAGALENKLSFANETHSGVLRVAVTTQNPELSASIANELTREFLDFKRQAKFQAMQRAHDWFQDQMGKLSTQLAEADRAVEDYRLEHRLDDQSPNDGDGGLWAATINRQQLDTITHELAEVSRARALKEGELVQAQRALRGEIPTTMLPQVLVSPTIAQLSAETSIVAGHLAQLTTSQGAGNPELVAVQAQLRKLQTTTTREMLNVAASLGSDVKAILAQEEALKKSQENFRSAVSQENRAQLGLRSLQTKARATRGIYESFVSRATQLANVAGIQEQDASLVSSARPPLGPSAPQSGRIVAVAVVLSLVVSVAVACLLDRLRTGFSLPEQLEATIGMPLIGVIPRVSRRAIRSPGRSRASIAFSASLDKLRGQISIMGPRRPKVILITSALPKEGKSVLASSLAISAAASGWRVLLLECDFYCPSLAARFDLKAEAGLSDILAGHSLSELKTLITEARPGLHVMLAGRGKGSRQELLGSSRMTELLAMVRPNYDLVLLDAPPILPVADSLVLSVQADATLMVVRWENTARNATKDALRMLHSTRAKIMGAVMTRVDLRTASMSGGRMSYAFSSYDGHYVTSA